MATKTTTGEHDRAYRPDGTRIMSSGEARRMVQARWKKYASREERRAQTFPMRYAAARGVLREAEEGAAREAGQTE